MALLKRNQKVKEISVYGVKEVESDIYYRPVNIGIDANLCICQFSMEGRRKNIHGKREFFRDYTIEVDKKKDVFKQIYSFVKSLDEFKGCESV